MIMAVPKENQSSEFEDARSAEPKLPAAISKHWLTRHEACRVLGISRTTLARKVQEGLLKKSLYNGLIIVSRASVERYLKQWN